MKHLSLLAFIMLLIICKYFIDIRKSIKQLEALETSRLKTIFNKH